MIYSFSYRHLIPESVLALAPLGAFNLHPSLLPAYRGRAPVNWVLVNGEREAGVTLHHMVARADAGDIVGQRAVAIDDNDNALTLYRKLVPLGVELIDELHPKIVAGTAPRRKMDISKGSYFGRRKPDDGRIDWRWPARRIFNLVRAVTHPYPGAFCFVDGRKLLVWEAKIGAESGSLGAPGRVVREMADGALEIAAERGQRDCESRAVRGWRRRHCARGSFAIRARHGYYSIRLVRGGHMRVLITGGAGFLGSHLSDAFIARGDEVFVLDTGSIAKVRHILNNPRFHYVHDSVFNVELIDSLVSKVDLVYHLAAVVGVEHYVADPYETLNVNVNGTQNVLKAAYKHGTRLVFSSTSEVYGRNPKVPWREDDDRVLGATSIDRWCYSTSKAVGEHFCFAYHKLGMPVTVVRYFNAYGPRLDKVDVGRLFTIFMGQLLRGADLTVVGDGLQTRCFTYVTDAIEATVQAGVNPAADGEAINIGVDVETTVLEFAKLMLELFGPTKSKIKFVSQEEVYGNSYEDIPRRVPDNTKMRTLLKVTPKVNLREGVKISMDWFRKEMAS